MKYGNILAVFFLVLVQLQPLYSDILLTEKEYQELMILIENSESKLKDQEETLKRLQGRINLQEIILEEQDKYLKTQKLDRVIKTLRDLGIGFTIGFWSSYLGVK